MWRWLRLLTGWHMRDWLAHTLSSLSLAAAPQVRSLQISWKKNGLKVEGGPVLTTADDVMVCADLRYAPSTPVRKADLSLRIGRQHVPVDSLTPQPDHGSRQMVQRAEFHLEPPETSETLELCWRGQSLCQAALPVLSLRQFVERLQLSQPTLYVSLRSTSENVDLREHTVPCRKYPRMQGRRVFASALWISPTPLVGLLDCHPVVIFREQATGKCWEVPLRLSAEQLLSRQAVVTVECPERPRRVSRWTMEWRLLHEPRGSCEWEVSSMRSLHRQIELVEAYFVWQDDKSNRVRCERRLPEQLPPGRLGPCFVLRSREAGLGFLARVDVFATFRDGCGPVQLASEEILISDAPNPYMPGTIAVSDRHQLAAFELRSGGYTIGYLPISPVPCAKINGEGAFQAPPEDLTWSPAFDEELKERLNRLMDPP